MWTLIVIVIVLLGVGWYAFTENAVPLPTSQSTTVTSTTSEMTDAQMSAMPGMATYTDASDTFSFTYPARFILSPGEAGQTQSWRSGATSTGLEIAVVAIPASFQPNTNFGDGKFTFGASTDSAAVSHCLTDANGNGVESSTVTIKGATFTKLTFSDAGAGNIYQVTSYRTIRNNRCYAAEYIIHSTNLANYPSDQGIVAFDANAVRSVLEGIAQSVTFVK